MEVRREEICGLKIAETLRFDRPYVAFIFEADSPHRVILPSNVDELRRVLLDTPKGWHEEILAVAEQSFGIDAAALRDELEEAI